MNRYPIWIYVIVACAMVLGFTYTLPNFFGESPAVQVSSIKATVKVDSDLLARVEAALKAASIVNQGTFLDSNSVKVRFADTDTQLKAKDVLSQSLNPERDDPSYVVALNLLSSSPKWLTAIHALPMYLGLDLRGGVHFTAAGGHEGGADQAAGEPDRGHPRRAARQEPALFRHQPRRQRHRCSVSATPTPAPRRARCWRTTSRT